MKSMWLLLAVLALPVVAQTPAPPTPPKLKLSWTDNSTNEAGFLVQRSIDNAVTWVDLMSVAANVTEYTDQGLVDGRSYAYRVRAFNAAGASAFTPHVSAIALSPPNAPSGMNVQPVVIPPQ